MSGDPTKVALDEALQQLEHAEQKLVEVEASIKKFLFDLPSRYIAGLREDGVLSSEIEMEAFREIARREGYNLCFYNELSTGNYQEYSPGKPYDQKLRNIHILYSGAHFSTLKINGEYVTDFSIKAQTDGTNVEKIETLGDGNCLFNAYIQARDYHKQKIEHEYLIDTDKEKYIESVPPKEKEEFLKKLSKNIRAKKRFDKFLDDQEKTYNEMVTSMGVDLSTIKQSIIVTDTTALSLLRRKASKEEQLKTTVYKVRQQFCDYLQEELQKWQRDLDASKDIAPADNSIYSVCKLYYQAIKGSEDGFLVALEGIAYDDDEELFKQLRKETQELRTARIATETEVIELQEKVDRLQQEIEEEESEKDEENPEIEAPEIPSRISFQSSDLTSVQWEQYFPKQSSAAPILKHPDVLRSRSSSGDRSNENKYDWHDAGGGGNCLFLSICDQLERRELTKYIEEAFKAEGILDANEKIDHNTLRKLVADQIEDYWDYYKAFITDKDLERAGLGKDKSASGLLSEDKSKYIAKIKENGYWGDHVSIVAAAELLGVNVVVKSSLGKKHDTDILLADIEPTIYLGHIAEVHYKSLIEVEPKSDEASKARVEPVSVLPGLFKNFYYEPTVKSTEETESLLPYGQILSRTVTEQPNLITVEPTILSLPPAESKLPEEQKALFEEEQMLALIASIQAITDVRVANQETEPLYVDVDEFKHLDKLFNKLEELHLKLPIRILPPPSLLSKELLLSESDNSLIGRIIEYNCSVPDVLEVGETATIAAAPTKNSPPKLK